MVCARCIRSVKAVFEKAGVDASVQLGVVTLENALTEKQRTAIGQELNAEGFMLLDDQKVLYYATKTKIYAVLYGTGTPTFSERYSAPSAIMSFLVGVISTDACSNWPVNCAKKRAPSFSVADSPTKLTCRRNSRRQRRSRNAT